MPHTTSIPEYCAVLTRSKLLPESDIPSLAEEYLQQSQAPRTDVEGFRKFLVQKRKLTEYRAALIQRGHSEGYLLGPYTIEDRIGKGQSAGVYLARHRSGQRVALKVLPSSKAKEERHRQRFLREGRWLLQLQHPNVVRGFEVGQDQGFHFIAMEYIPGETLAEVLERRQKLPWAEATRLMVQLLEGLQHLHEQRMVHRDLKPANLMIRYPAGPAGGPRLLPRDTLDATLKILDIGIGREILPEDGSDLEDLHLTAEGSILGTPDYLAPEQARDPRKIDIRADLYSVGCVLFHGICGRPPFVEQSIMALVVRHATEPAPALGGFVSDLPSGYQAVVDQLLAKKPADRIATPKDAAQALRAFLPSDTTEAELAPVVPEFTSYLERETRPAAVAGSSEVTQGAKVEPKPRPLAPQNSSPRQWPLPDEAPTTPTTPITPATAAIPARAATPAEPWMNVELVPDVAAPLRPWWDLDRRDLVLLVLGGSLVLLAILIGTGLAEWLRQPANPTAPATILTTTGETATTPD